MGLNLSARARDSPEQIPWHTKSKVRNLLLAAMCTKQLPGQGSASAHSLVNVVVGGTF